MTVRAKHLFFAFLVLAWSAAGGIAGAGQGETGPAKASHRPGPASIENFTRRGRGVDFGLAGGGFVRLDVLTDNLVRVRASADGKFGESLPIQWGFVKDDWPAATFQVEVTRSASTFISRSRGVVSPMSRS